LKDLSQLIVAELPKHYQGKEASRTPHVFINFIMNDEGDAMAVTPWDWHRPLTDFLPTSCKGQQLSEGSKDSGDVVPPTKRQRILYRRRNSIK